MSDSTEQRIQEIHQILDRHEKILGRVVKLLDDLCSNLHESFTGETSAQKTRKRWEEENPY